MGWTTKQHYGRPSKKIIDDDLAWENETTRVHPIKSVVVNFRTYYAALAIEDKASGKIEVVGAVVLIQRGKEEIMTKEMTEECGPNERACPAGILDLLSPTSNEYATQWRADCRVNAQRASKANRVKLGDRVLFSCAYAGERQWYVFERKGARVLFSRTPGGYPMKLKGWKGRVLEVTPAH